MLKRLTKTRLVKKLFIAGLVMMAVIPFLPSSAPSVGQAYLEQLQNGTIDWTKGTITVKGIGAPPKMDNLQSKAQLRPMTMQAAKSDAYRNLAAIVYGVRVDSETIVENLTVKSDVVKTQVHGFVQGAVPGEPKYFEDGTIEMEMSAKLFGKDALGGIILPVALKGGLTDVKQTPPPSSGDVMEKIKWFEEQLKKMQQELEDLKNKVIKQGRRIFAPRTAWAETKGIQMAFSDVKLHNKAYGQYTGLIIDATDVSVKPAMAPKIFSQDGSEVFGNAIVDPEAAIEKGIAVYVKSLDDAKTMVERIGENPYVAKALDVKGTLKADPVVSSEVGNELKTAVLPDPLSTCSLIIVTN